ncbi:hypothetical protein [Sphingomonas turrisvirgatae]|uniref:Uncharacterized protein n=1 Tax=Sphingomonas turrisvirgatae TaxID=1888892 RepID=A0A1E3M1N4_9SPHN|nr:hypothetical protein [Sphingomonas turrisvirgatae]ODP39265.1 hypothetical protein BFL28_10655 [Sphingomonas turrisvirgatae]
MCVSAKAPDVPSIPERQATKLPDQGATAGRSDAMARRRRGLYASILTSPQGALGAANVSGISGATLG